MERRDCRPVPLLCQQADCTGLFIALSCLLTADWKPDWLSGKVPVNFSGLVRRIWFGAGVVAYCITDWWIQLHFCCALEILNTLFVAWPTGVSALGRLWFWEGSWDLVEQFCIGHRHCRDAVRSQLVVQSWELRLYNDILWHSTLFLLLLIWNSKICLLWYINLKMFCPKADSRREPRHIIGSRIHIDHSQPQWGVKEGEKYTRPHFRITQFWEFLTSDWLLELCETLTVTNPWLYWPSRKFGIC